MNKVQESKKRSRDDSTDSTTSLTDSASALAPAVKIIKLPSFEDVPEYYMNLKVTQKKKVPDLIKDAPVEVEIQDKSISSFYYKQFVCKTSFVDDSNQEQKTYEPGNPKGQGGYFGNPIDGVFSQQEYAFLFFSVWLKFREAHPEIVIPNPITKTFRKVSLWNESFANKPFMYERILLPFNVPFPITFSCLFKCLFFEKNIHFTLSIFDNQATASSSNNHAIPSEWNPNDFIIRYVQSQVYPNTMYRCQDASLCFASAKCYASPTHLTFDIHDTIRLNNKIISSSMSKGLVFCQTHFIQQNIITLCSNGNHYHTTGELKNFSDDISPLSTAGAKKKFILDMLKHELREILSPLSEDFIFGFQHPTICPSKMQPSFYFQNTKVRLFHIFLLIYTYQDLSKFSTRHLINYCRCIFWDCILTQRNCITPQYHHLRATNHFLENRQQDVVVFIRFNPDFYIVKDDSAFLKYVQDPYSIPILNHKCNFLAQVCSLFYLSNEYHRLIRRIQNHYKSLSNPYAIYTIDLFFDGFDPSVSLENIKVLYISPHDFTDISSVVVP